MQHIASAHSSRITQSHNQTHMCCDNHLHQQRWAYVHWVHTHTHTHINITSNMMTTRLHKRSITFFYLSCKSFTQHPHTIKIKLTQRARSSASAMRANRCITTNCAEAIIGKRLPDASGEEDARCDKSLSSINSLANFCSNTSIGRSAMPMRTERAPNWSRRWWRFKAAA